MKKTVTEGRGEKVNLRKVKEEGKENQDMEMNINTVGEKTLPLIATDDEQECELNSARAVVEGGEGAFRRNM